MTVTTEAELLPADRQLLRALFSHARANGWRSSDGGEWAWINDHGDQIAVVETVWSTAVETELELIDGANGKVVRLSIASVTDVVTILAALGLLPALNA